MFQLSKSVPSFAIINGLTSVISYFFDYRNDPQFSDGQV